MDLQYLIWLQELRESANNVLTPFMMNISDFAIFYSILIPSFIYWCLNKRNGLYVFFVIVFNGMLASCIKLTACVYRPWIREPKIIPAGDSIRTATGYSFPSGHTTMATAVYGGSALALRKKWSYILAGLVILTTAFSRNYLGVHTPQDVICGFLLAVFSIRSLAKALKYIEQHRGYHLCAFAKNPKGYHNLNALQTDGDKQRYYNPIWTFSALFYTLYLFSLCCLLFINFQNYCIMQKGNIL